MADRPWSKSVPTSREPSEVSANLFHRQRGFWTKLAVYRPLAVLAGIWVLLLAISLLAYGQLLHTTKDTQEVEVSASDLQTYPHQRLDKNTDSQPTDTPQSENSSSRSTDNAPAPQKATNSSVATVPPSTDEGFSEWSLVALVGTCALGCWLISAKLKAPKRPRQSSKKGGGFPHKSAVKKRLISPREPQSVPANQPQKTNSAVKLPPYDPTKPLMVDSFASSGTAARPPSPGNLQAQSPSQSAPPLPPTDVTVVSQEHQHRLDWPEDSLINTADVRQRRSLSSFL